MSRNLLRLEKGIMMKIEIEKDFPQYFKPAYPEEFELFSHFEVTAGIPTVLFAVTFERMMIWYLQKISF